LYSKITQSSTHPISQSDPKVQKLFPQVVKQALRKCQNIQENLGFLLQVAILKKNQRVKPTPPKIEMEPENDGLEDDFPLPGVYSQVPC